MAACQADFGRVEHHEPGDLLIRIEGTHSQMLPEDHIHEVTASAIRMLKCGAGCVKRMPPGAGEALAGERKFQRIGCLYDD